MRLGSFTTLACALALVGCGGERRTGDAPAPLEAPSFPLEALAGLTYRGLESGTVTLVEGDWEGPPFEPGGATRPSVHLDFSEPVVGDLDGDGRAEATVVLSEQLGGSGVWVYLAVISHRDGELENVATTRLGDRVGIHSMRYDRGRVVVEFVEAGPADPACCPTQKMRASWRLVRGALHQESREELGSM